jgi:hypothetical protein
LNLYPFWTPVLKAFFWTNDLSSIVSSSRLVSVYPVSASYFKYPRPEVWHSSNASQGVDIKKNHTKNVVYGEYHGCE